MIGAGPERLFVYDASSVPTLRLTCPPDVRVECGRGPLPDKTGGFAKATGGCSPVRISYADSSANGPRPIVKVITRTWTATDACGNHTTCQQRITIVDTIGPVIHRLTAAPARLAPANNQFVTVKLDALVIDSCSTEMQVAEKSTRTVKVTDPAGSDGKSYFVVKSLKEVQLRAKQGVSCDHAERGGLLRQQIQQDDHRAGALSRRAVMPWRWFRPGWFSCHPGLSIHWGGDAPEFGRRIGGTRMGGLIRQAPFVTHRSDWGVESHRVQPRLHADWGQEPPRFPTDSRRTQRGTGGGGRAASAGG